MLAQNLVTIFLVLVTCAVRSSNAYNPRPYTNALRARQSTNANSSLEVDLGYAVYRGYSNSSTGLNIWKGSASTATHL
jgi:hypothetical protein